MSKNPSNARNLEFLNKQVKKLKKNTILPHHSDYQAAVAQDHGFPNWDNMVSYVKGRPRRENDGIVISENPNLTLLEALNERAVLQGMPPIGSRIRNEHGIEWQIVNYEFYRTPTTIARYPGDCDYLPVVVPLNISKRLHDFIAETDRCTSKRIIFIDTMPKAHPFRIGENIHCANFGIDPEESYIFLDVDHAHETTFAHEIAHLWLIYVNGGDGCRILRDRSDHAKINQLDFLQSFVVDLKVNDLIEERGFDMSLINIDHMNSLKILRDAINLGHKPHSPREALVNSLSIAAAILEQKRMPSEMQQILDSVLKFYASVTPEIFQLAQRFVGIVRQHGYNSQDALRKVLDAAITLGFRATGDDFNLKMDLEEPILVECMQDKHPAQFCGLPVLIKLEIGKTMARHGISGEGRVWLSTPPDSPAQMIAEDKNGKKIGPLLLPLQFVQCHPTPGQSSNRANPPNVQNTRRYMAGVGLSIAQTGIPPIKRTPS